MHPAHVPLEIEADATLADRLGNPAERGRLLGDHERAGIILVHKLVGCPQEINGLDILTAAILIGNPLPFLARIVEVEHRGDRIHPEAVDMVAIQP